MAFVDANVLPYTDDANDPARHDRARSLVSSLGRTGAVGVQVIQEVYATAVTKIAQPLTPTDARHPCRQPVPDLSRLSVRGRVMDEAIRLVRAVLDELDVNHGVRRLIGARKVSFAGRRRRRARFLAV